MPAVTRDMNTNLSEIHAEIERLSEERAELWHRLSAEYDPEIKEEIRRLDAELDRLWDDHRALRARVRFGDRDGDRRPRAGRRAPRTRRLSRSAVPPPAWRSLDMGVDRPDLPFDPVEVVSAAPILNQRSTPHDPDRRPQSRRSKSVSSSSRCARPS